MEIELGTGSMKRILFVLLMVACSVSWADWELVSSDAESIEYADKSTKRQNEGFVEMWRMTNYFEGQSFPSGEKFFSTKILERHDCVNKTTGTISVALYSQLNGSGKVIHTHFNKKNKIEDGPIAPQTVGENNWKVACGKK